MQTEIARRLRYRHPAFPNKPHSLKLEFARIRSSRHNPPPIPSNTLTRCLRNQGQARSPLGSVLTVDGLQRGTGGDDTLTAALAGDNAIFGLDGNDVILGSSGGNDVLHGGQGGDIVNANA